MSINFSKTSNARLSYSIAKIVSDFRNLSSYDLKVLLAGSIGTIGEFYDFFLVFVCYNILGTIFFPESTDASFIALRGIIIASIGNFARPIGSIIFGYLGDKYGRVNSLSWTMYIMGFSSLIIGFLPSFATIGYLSLIIFALCRAAQGIAMGGESSGMMVYMQEKFPKYSLLVSAFTSSVYAIGCTLASLSYNWALKLESYTEHYWRLPFIMSVLLALMASYFRYQLYDCKEYQEHKKLSLAKKAPIIGGFWSDLRKYDAIKIGIFCLITSVMLSFSINIIMSLQLFLKYSTSLSQSEIAGVVGGRIFSATFGILLTGLIYQFLIVPRFSIKQASWIVLPLSFMGTLYGIYSIKNAGLDILSLPCMIFEISTAGITLYSYYIYRFVPVAIRFRLVLMSYTFVHGIIAGFFNPVYMKLLNAGYSPYAPFYILGPLIVVVIISSSLMNKSKIN